MSDLHRIERYARHALNDAISAGNAVKLLAARPDFETKARDTLCAARDRMASSLVQLQEAIDAYDTKSINP